MAYSGTMSYGYIARRRLPYWLHPKESLVADSRRTRGEGSIYQRESDGRWIGVVDLGWVGGRRVRRTVSAQTLRELRPKFKALKQQIEQGVLPDEATVEQWMEHWMEHVATPSLRPSTLRTYRGYIDGWIKPHLGKRRLDRLRPDHVRALYAEMEKQGKSDATRRQVHAILRRALVVAERDGRIASNPATKVEPPRVGQGSHGKFTLAEAKQILATLDDPSVCASRWACALLAGLRQGEALGLRWEDVDFENGLLFVERAVQRIPRQGLQVVPLKSRTSRRAVPMVPPVYEALKAEPSHEGFVWGGEKPTDPRKDWQAWRDLLALAGVGPKPLHAARATTASLLMEAGVADKLIAEILGHSQVIITREKYLHGDVTMHRAAMESLGKMLTEGGSR
jgi:integrase